MGVAVVPLLMAVAGLLMWALSSNAKVSRAGEIRFFCGSLALALSLASKQIHF